MITVRVDAAVESCETHLRLRLDPDALAVNSSSNYYGPEPISHVSISSGDSFVWFKGPRQELLTLLAQTVRAIDPAFEFDESASSVP
jgi:hypothetical protein